MEWKTTEPPKDQQILAYGYPIEKFSGLRLEITHDIVEWHDYYRAFISVDDADYNSTHYDVLGWLEVPDYLHSDPIQPVPEGKPKYAVGDVTQYETRYEGIHDVTITSVHIWPNGFYYGLDQTWYLGHGNGSVGADEIEYFHDGELYRRPISEYELDYRSEFGMMGKINGKQ